MTGPGAPSASAWMTSQPGSFRVARVTVTRLSTIGCATVKTSGAKVANTAGAATNTVTISMAAINTTPIRRLRLSIRFSCLALCKDNTVDVLFLTVRLPVFW